MRQRTALALLATAALASTAMVACAQPEPSRSARPIVANAHTDEPPPISPKTSPGPMSLDACIELGFQHQPALAAAQASLSAAHAGKRGIDRVRVPVFLKPDIRIRREQSSYGIDIAGAALIQAESETRYAITRNFLTVQYIRSQQRVISDVIFNLEKGYERAETVFKAGDATAKITRADLTMIKASLQQARVKKNEADTGMKKALAALREAMGLGYDYPLDIAVVDLPPAVYVTKKTVTTEVEEKDKDGKTTKKLIKKDVDEYHRLYHFDKAELIAAAVANRPEMAQATAASQVTRLEIAAQWKMRGYKGETFARGADIHVQPIPQGIMNGEYRPGAFAIEYPTLLAGPRPDRAARACALHDRVLAVIEKAHNLVSLDVEVQYLKWEESVDDIRILRDGFDETVKLPDDYLKLVQGKDMTGPGIVQANIMAINVRTSLNDQMHLHALSLAGLERATAGAFRIYPVPTPPKK
jgi:hypothetical protein